MTKISARIGRAIPSLVICGVVLGVGVMAPGAAVAQPDGSVREADRHFQRGVALYVEADYRGALVEFERAYTLAPNGIVLFNVGETQYQLRDYAAALATFEHYLVEAPANDSHRTLAEANIKELRTRVGRLRIVTVPAGAEISIDDKVVGQTPFEKAIVVGIGQLSVRATMPGRRAGGAHRRRRGRGRRAADDRDARGVGAGRQGRRAGSADAHRPVRHPPPRTARPGASPAGSRPGRSRRGPSPAARSRTRTRRI